MDDSTLDPKTSFIFDDNNEFAVPINDLQDELRQNINRQKIVYQGFFSINSKKLKNFQQIFCVITSQYIYQNNEQKIQNKALKFSIKNARLLKIKKIDDNNKTYYGLKLSKNNDEIDLFLDQKERCDLLFNQLKKITILTNFDQQFKVKKSLGKNKASELFLVHNKKQKKFQTAKFYSKNYISKDQINLSQLLTEIDVLRLLDNENVVKYQDIYESKSYVIIVEEYFFGGDLINFLYDQKQYDEFTVATIIQRILLSVQYIHSLNIIHRDIKPMSVFIKENNSNKIALADFSQCEFLNQRIPNLKAPTPGYAAPELLNDQAYDKKVDIYSVGIIMLTGTLPFKAQEFDKLLVQNKEGLIDFQIFQLESISDSGNNLLKKLLNLNSAERPSAKEALSDSWFQEMADLQKLGNGSNFNNSQTLISHPHKSEPIYVGQIDQLLDPNNKQTNPNKSTTPYFSQKVDMSTFSPVISTSQLQIRKKNSTFSSYLLINDNKPSLLNQGQDSNIINSLVELQGHQSTLEDAKKLLSNQYDAAIEYDIPSDEDTNTCGLNQQGLAPKMKRKTVSYSNK